MRAQIKETTLLPKTSSSSSSSRTMTQDNNNNRSSTDFDFGLVLSLPCSTHHPTAIAVKIVSFVKPLLAISIRIFLLLFFFSFFGISKLSEKRKIRQKLKDSCYPPLALYSIYFIICYNNLCNHLQRPHKSCPYSFSPFACIFIISFLLYSQKNKNSAQCPLRTVSMFNGDRTHKHTHRKICFCFNIENHFFYQLDVALYIAFLRFTQFYLNKNKKLKTKIVKT